MHLLVSPGCPRACVPLVWCPLASSAWTAHLALLGGCLRAMCSPFCGWESLSYSTCVMSSGSPLPPLCGAARPAVAGGLPLMSFSNIVGRSSDPHGGGTGKWCHTANPGAWWLLRPCWTGGPYKVSSLIAKQLPSCLPCAIIHLTARDLSIVIHHIFLGKYLAYNFFLIFSFFI